MKVLYDHQAFTMQYFGGVSKCFCELISHFPNGVETEISIVQSDNVHLKQSGLCGKLHPVDIDSYKFREQYNFRGAYRLYCAVNKLFPSLPTAENINKLKSIELLKSREYDIFHPTFFDSYFLPYLDGKPFVLTIHDMMPEIFLQYFGKNDMQIKGKKKLVDKASAIIAVSKQTKNDLIDILKVPENKVTVIYHGGPQKEAITGDPIIKVPYFLYMGTRNAYKNFDRLVIAFSQVAECHKDLLLVCTGGDFNASEMKLLQQYGVEDRVVHLFASESDVKNLYAFAKAFIYPSLYEGFGMPILEAFAYGCPVLLNKKSCFPEIADDAGLFFHDDNDFSDLREKMEEVLDWNDEKRNLIIQRGYERLTFFRWEESSRQLLAVYHSVMNR